MPYGDSPKRLTWFLVLWITGLVTWVVVRSFGENPPDIPAGTVTALGIITGLPGIILGVYQWAYGKRRKPDD